MAVSYSKPVIKRRTTRQIQLGKVKVGGDAPITVQSMTKTETADFDATMKQIHAIAEAGGDLVRCAVPRDEDVHDPYKNATMKGRKKKG